MKIDENDIRLLQFRYSPYNEKVRWALDRKRVDHSRRSLLPGPHIPIVKKLTGQTATPILWLDGAWITGSARILAELERRFPEPALLPPDPEDRHRALEIEARFDSVLGPDIRRAVLGENLRHLDYMARMFAEGRPWPARLAYRATIPLAAGLIRKGNGLDEPGAAERGIAAAEMALDEVAQASAATGYLAGGAFSLADLTAAAMLAPLVNPPGSPMQRPQPMPESLAGWISRWQDHPGADWVRRMYRQHREISRDVEGPVRYGTPHSNPVGQRP